MNLSDSEIMMLEQLAYFDNIDEGDASKTIGEILSEYKETSLDLGFVDKTNSNDKLSYQSNTNSLNSKTFDLILNEGEKAALESAFPPVSSQTLSYSKNEAIESAVKEYEERGAVIRYVTENDKMNNLVLHSTMKDADGKTLAFCFVDENNPDEAVVIFKGTTSKEWGDNVEGLNAVETERQLQAKEYIDGLPFESITVAGHSKGGNKAMYVAICCENVSRCVSMDGQGFSREFIEEYEPEIARRAGIIKNYSVSTDYVHVLLFQIPGSEQLYCEGYRIGNDIGGHHEPLAFFQIDSEGNIVCENGNPVVVTEKNGKPITEDPSVVMLHQFTAYVLNVAPPEDKERIVKLIATALDMALGEKRGALDIADFLLSDAEGLSLVVAYLVKYMDTYDLTVDDIDELLQMLGLKTLDEYIGVDIFGIKFGISDLLTSIQKNLTDGENDPIINAILSSPNAAFGLVGSQMPSLSDFWKSTEDKINSIPSVSKSDGIKEPQISINVSDLESIADAILRVDTAKLRSYAERLTRVNGRIVTLDKELDSLYWKVGLRDLWNLIRADLMTGSNKRILNCAKYLNETAIDFESTERKVVDQF